MKGGRTAIARTIFGILLLALFIPAGSAAQMLAPGELAPFASARSNRPQTGSLTKLTSEEVQMIIESEAEGNPRALKALADDSEQRKKVLENLKQALAIASEARNTGFANDESIKMQLHLARLEILATAYDHKLKAAAGRPNDPGPPFGFITDKNVDAFFALPANKTKYASEQEKFLAFIRDMQAKSTVPVVDMDEEQKKFIISQWRKVIYGTVKAEALKLNDRKTELLWKLQQALILARSYSQEKLKDQLTPTGDEIKAYMEADARFSKAAQRARAEEILAKVKAGSDFAALADQYTEDPGNKDLGSGKGQGGFYDWRDRGGYVREFSDAAWALEAGQTSQIVETQFGYHIIKLEGKRVEGGKELVKVRHILISTAYKPEVDPEANIVEAEEPFTTMEDAAKKELAKKKQLQVISDILLRNPIDLPDDFTVGTGAKKAPAAAAAKVKTAAKTNGGKAKKPAARSVKKKP